MYDVVALGELVIDFSPGGVSAKGNALYERQPGGAPSNVLAAVARLGGKAALIGSVGEDSFGYYLKDMAIKCGIDCTGLCFTDKAYTTLVFVHLDEHGERSYTALRRPGADTQLQKKQVNTELISNTNIMHISAASLTDNPCREAALFAAHYARQKKKLVSFDANYRELLWDKSTAITVMSSFLPNVDILKTSEEEMDMLTGTSDVAMGAKTLFEMGPALVTVTLGSEGTYFYYSGGEGFVPTYPVDVVDTNGAGDAYLGTLLYQISHEDKALDRIGCSDMEQMIRAASAAGALCAARSGALLGGPTWQEIHEIME